LIQTEETPKSFIKNFFMPKKPIVSQIIDELGLKTHPEGGYYRETYRSAEGVKRTNGNLRNAGTGIYFLLPSKVCTNWHRVDSDELWHFYQGDKLELEIINGQGDFEQRSLGDDLGTCSHQELVPRNCWQRAYSTGAYSLVGCTVAPGFEFDDFEMIDQESLANQYPEIASSILDASF
jgi:predicted cupin superfamily sugar epimerase